MKLVYAWFLPLLPANDLFWSPLFWVASDQPRTDRNDGDQIPAQIPGVGSHRAATDPWIRLCDTDQFDPKIAWNFATPTSLTCCTEQEILLLLFQML